MAHLVFPMNEDTTEDNLEVFCSDHCARTSSKYNGWNGCHEISHDQPCNNCNEIIKGLEEEL
mgnify:FL=1